MSNPESRATPDLAGYEFLRRIGVGGMGEVHLARQVSLNRTVAIKLMGASGVEPADRREARFRREAELMAGISHPNVATIFDFGEVDGRSYLVMEYVEGGDLRARLVPDQAMEPDAIRAILGPVLGAVGHLHERGVVHRDLKPENILMLRESTPKVTDFGVAVPDDLVGSLTRTGRSLGTPGYVAPEQQYGLKVDARADQYSLAALAYEMATGRKPLGAFPPPDQLNPRLGPEASRAIMKGLSEDPTNRFAKVGEFAEALDRGLVAARQGRRSAARWPVIVAASALFALGLAGAVLVPSPGSAFKLAAASPASDRVAISPGPVKVSGPSRLPDRLTAGSAGLSLVLVPAGEFWMGSVLGDPASQAAESPRHRVRISRPFYLGQTEVTAGQFRKFVEATGYQTSAEIRPQGQAEWGGVVFNQKLGRRERRPELNWKTPCLNRIAADDEPAFQISWDDAVAFCDWLTSREGRPFRLPTEAEWEYACRAGRDTRWCFGDDPARLDEFAWTSRNAVTAHPVGTRKPNDFGLFDMHGNAWEWCLDVFAPYAEVRAVDPQGPGGSGDRVMRGGSFGWEKVEGSRSAARRSFEPSMPYLSFGFRVCAPAP